MPIPTNALRVTSGEFSYIIASFGVANKLLDEALYSAIIFAVLLSAITSPIILTLLLKYYWQINKIFGERAWEDGNDRKRWGACSSAFNNTNPLRDCGRHAIVDQAMLQLPWSFCYRPEKLATTGHWHYCGF
jgi:hypothetical protein